MNAKEEKHKQQLKRRELTVMRDQLNKTITKDLNVKTNKK